MSGAVTPLLLTPLLTIGLLLSCTGFFLYLWLKVSHRYYLPLLLISIFSILYLVVEIAWVTMNAAESSALLNMFMLQRLLGLAPSVLLLLFIRDIVRRGGTRYRICSILVPAAALLGVFIIAAGLIHPPLIWAGPRTGLTFARMNNFSPGDIGPLWLVRDVFTIAVWIAAIAMLWIEAVRTRRYLFNSLILLGSLLVAFAYVFDFAHNYFPTVEQSALPVQLLPLGLASFVLFSAMAVVREFVANSRELTLTKDRLAFLAYHDGLTGLMNRQALSDRLHETIARARRSTTEQTCGLLMMDLDHFKRINDGISHDVGDKILTAFANRIKNRIRSSDSFFRIGGDEFAIILTQLKQPTDAAVVAEKILAAMADPFLVDDDTLYLGCSIGISIFPKDADTSDQLMIRADSALSEGKRERNVYRFYTRQMQLDATRKMKLLGSLRSALVNDELSLVFQPQIAADGSIIGAEALLRWHSQELGTISPGEFIPIAEESGLITMIGKWVIEQACVAAQYWRSIGLPAFPVAVNLSARQLRDEHLVTHIRTTLSYYQLQPELLHIEITESSVLDNPEYAIAMLHRLHSLGVNIAIDDFGTGFSSLSYLKELPVDYVKIDRSFFLELPNDAKSSSLVLGIISMIEGLGLSIIAEGVETDTQVSFLYANAPVVIQGFFYSKPLPTEEFVTFVREINRQSSGALSDEE